MAEELLAAKVADVPRREEFELLVAAVNRGGAACAVCRGG